MTLASARTIDLHVRRMGVLGDTKGPRQASGGRVSHFERRHFRPSSRGNVRSPRRYTRVRDGEQLTDQFDGALLHALDQVRAEIVAVLLEEAVRIVDDLR